MFLQNFFQNGKGRSPPSPLGYATVLSWKYYAIVTFNARSLGPNPEIVDDTASESTTSERRQRAFAKDDASLLRRRHSVGPFQFAKRVNEYIHRGKKYSRQMSAMNRGILPKPPSEFFEPMDLPVSFDLHTVHLDVDYYTLCVHLDVRLEKVISLAKT
jgi:hypothetical protein